nr:hypothetical protein [Tanacetum cinerariifolium]
MVEVEIHNFIMEQYLTLTRGNQAPGVVKPEIGGNMNFKIKSQFMRELREDTFSGNKNGDDHEHVKRVLDIVSLFNILGVTHDAVMLRVFPITLIGATKRKAMKHYTKPRRGMTPAQALTGIHTIADYSQKWHDGSSSRNIDSSSNSEGIVTIECPLNEKVKSMEVVKYGEFGRPFPNNGRNNSRFNREVS